MTSKYLEERRKKEENKPISQIIITNQDKDKIDIKSEFDNKFNIWRIEVKCK